MQDAIQDLTRTVIYVIYCPLYGVCHGGGTCKQMNKI